ncbi:MAG: response regulator transcription factor [Candidatus Dormibacteria bacterium]
MTEHPELANAGPGSLGVPGNLTVLLLDDHAVMLESVRAIVETDDTLTVVGTASRVPDAILLAAETHPQVAVIDVNMPDGGGWAAARGLREVCPDIRLVAYSSFDEALVIRTIRAAGISAFVTKGADIDVLLAAIHGEDIRPVLAQANPLMRRTAAVAAG